MFAFYYEQLMEDIDYKEILTPLLPYLPNKDKQLLDAGCGPGFILKELIELGYDVIGIDNDEEMLRLANQRLDNPNHLYYHDLNEPLTESFDGIIMLFDVINYFYKLNPMIKNIYEGLNAHGVFIFDTYKKEYLETMRNFEEIDDEPFEYTWKTVSDKTKLNHTFIVKNKQYQINQYVYDKKTYLKHLKKVGFKNVKIIEGNDERKDYYICKK
ncbi:MAG: class I SAM-dependent methyltransferase [Candidatus Phytoplasma sp.]|mgnify:CR=1 FL=1|nr:class I SAM-dependent methyltransferase [Phytoplasma sp.]